MNPLSGSLFRLACDQATRDNVTDSLGGASRNLTIWKNCSATFQGAIFLAQPSADSLLTNLSNIVSLQMVLRSGGPTGALLCPEKTVLAGALKSDLTWAQWIDGSQQHFQFLFTPDDTNVAAQTNVFLSIGATTTNAGVIPLATNSQVRVYDSGLFNPGVDANPTLPYTAWSKVEADARYPLGSPEGGVILSNVDTGTSFRLVVRGSDAEPTIAFLSNA